MIYTVYILKLRDDTYYTGYTNNLERRMKQHNDKQGSKYVRSRLPFVVVYQEQFESRSAAMRRELEIKKLTRSKKSLLIEKYLNSLKET